jgi:hypothetical protein
MKNQFLDLLLGCLVCVVLHELILIYIVLVLFVFSRSDEQINLSTQK